MKEEQVSLDLEKVAEEKEDGINILGIIIVVMIILGILGTIIWFAITSTIKLKTDQYDYQISIDGREVILIDDYVFRDYGIFSYRLEGEKDWHYLKDYSEIIIRPIKLDE